MLLEVSDLSVARGGVPVLTGVSFTLRPGQLQVLRGPNGSGKTTLLRTLSGLQPALTGTVNTHGEIAYASHADGLKSMLSVTENLTFWARIFGTEDIGHALQAFELEPLRTRLAGALSAGQKRRLGLARMLVTGCPVWLMDEPTVSLDTHATALFAAAVQAHLDDGGAALIATHIDLGIAGAETLDVTAHRATAATATQSTDEAFL